MQKISVITPIYNAQRTISYFLDCLINQNYNKNMYEIILVDDCSTDETIRIIQEKIIGYKNISFTQLEKNYGPSMARNIGAKNAKYDILAFIDSDAYADINRLLTISQAFTKNNIVACGGMIDNYNHGFFSNINHIAEFSAYYSKKESVRRIIPSANLIFIKKIFQELGGFDEMLRIGEDTDLTFRLQKSGYQLHYYPNIIIRHDTEGTLHEGIKRQLKYGLGAFLCRVKNPGDTYHFVFNKPLFIIAFPIYILGSTFIHICRRAFGKHLLKSILGIPFLFFLRCVFWIGVFRFIFILNKKQTCKELA